MIKNVVIASIFISLKILAMDNFNPRETPLYAGQKFMLNFVDESWLKKIEDPANSNMSTFYDGHDGKPPKVTQHQCVLYDGMAKKATLETNGFEFVDLRSYSDDIVKILAQLNEAIILNDGTALLELKKLYIIALKNAAAVWWRENKADDKKNVEWLPFYESCADIRTSEENKLPNYMRPPVKMVHVDYCSRTESLRYFSLLHEDMIKLKDNQKVLRDVNIWAPTAEFCGGTPLAVADVASLDKNSDLNQS